MMTLPTDRERRGASQQPEARPGIAAKRITRPDLQATVARLGRAMLLRKPIDVPALRRAAIALMGGAS